MSDTITRESIISAKMFYEITFPRQQERVASIMRQAMSGTNRKVRLPFDTYPDLDDLLLKIGWEYDEETSTEDSAVYQPVVDVIHKEFEANDDIPSAKEFYEATLANQWKSLQESLLLAAENGEPIVKLPFMVYSVIKEKMEAKGWEYEAWYESDTDTEYSSFYPGEDEE